MATTNEDKVLRIYCPEHKSDFIVQRESRLLCQDGGHVLSNNFPQSEYWEYCCDCQRYWLSSGNNGKAASQCPVCDREIARRFLCATCKIISVESSETEIRFKKFTLKGEGLVEPYCPGCKFPVLASVRKHECKELGGTFKTACKQCPFCHDDIVSTVQTPFSFAGRSQADVSTAIPPSPPPSPQHQTPAQSSPEPLRETNYSLEQFVQTPIVQSQTAADNSSITHSSPTKMFCGNCGTENKVDDRFCKKCGTQTYWSKAGRADRAYNTKPITEQAKFAEPLQQTAPQESFIFCGFCGRQNRAEAIYCKHCGKKTTNEKNESHSSNPGLQTLNNQLTESVPNTFAANGSFKESSSSACLQAESPKTNTEPVLLNFPSDKPLAETANLSQTDVADSPVNLPQNKIEDITDLFETYSSEEKQEKTASDAKPTPTTITSTNAELLTTGNISDAAINLQQLNINTGELSPIIDNEDAEKVPMDFRDLTLPLPHMEQTEILPPSFVADVVETDPLLNHHGDKATEQPSTELLYSAPAQIDQETISSADNSDFVKTTYAQEDSGINDLKTIYALDTPQFEISDSDAGSSKRLVFVVGAAAACLLIITSLGIWLATRSSSSEENRPTAEKEPSTPPNMAYVPNGEFTMGGNDDEYERPPHKVIVKAFFIDKYEVTCEEYAKFVKETGHRAPQGWTNGNYPSGNAKKPVTGIDWEDANAFAKWAGKRLPTEEEWEYAARGTDGRIYPWGKDWKDGAANADKSNKGGVAEIGSFPDGQSPFGVYDMIGNAWEWTSSELKAYPGGTLPKSSKKGTLRIIRGGAWDADRKTDARVSYRGWASETGTDYNKTGLRCVKDIR